MRGGEPELLVGFAYGSNLHPARLRARVPSAEFLVRARLGGYELRFHKRGLDGSGKADAFLTGTPEHVVWGMLFTLDRVDKPRLDRVEDLGGSYRQVEVRVEAVDGGFHSAFAYVALPAAIEEGLPPYRWYKELVVAGAREHGFPAGYIHRLERLPARTDPDPARARRHRRLLGGR